MEQLKSDETDLQGELVTLKKSLADSEEELPTEKDKAAIERYLEQIKPGCDFIEEHYDTREQYRSEELTALNTAETKIKGTPAFAAAAAADKDKDWGVCAEKCGANEAHAD